MLSNFVPEILIYLAVSFVLFLKGVSAAMKFRLDQFEEDGFYFVFSRVRVDVSWTKD